MATRYTEEATAQIAPLYDQQQQAISSQIPAIQQLYNTLMQGLQTGYDTQLSTGVQGINEDASARGVLRSTLPNDSRAALTGQLGQALLEGRAQLGRQQAGDVAGINERLGSLGINRANAIAELSRSLESQDLDRQKFEYQKQLDQQQLQIERSKVGASRAPAEPTVQQEILNAFAADPGTPFYTENVVIPKIMSAYQLNKAQAADIIYKLRKEALGY